MSLQNYYYNQDDERKKDSSYGYYDSDERQSGSSSSPYGSLGDPYEEPQAEGGAPQNAWAQPREADGDVWRSRYTAGAPDEGQLPASPMAPAPLELNDENLNRCVREFYHSVVKPIFDEERARAEQAATDELRSFARRAGTDSSPFEGFGAAQRVSDPAKVVDAVLSRIKVADLDRLSDRFALVPGSVINSETLSEKYILPALRRIMLQDYVDREAPKNWYENLMREASSNSFVGKLGSLGLQNLSGTTTWQELQQAQREQYAPSAVEEVAAGVGSLILDAPLFSAWGAVASPAAGKATSLITNAIEKRLVANGVSSAAASQTAKRLVVDRLSNKIAAASTRSAITLGGVDATHDIVNQLLQQGDFSFGQNLAAFGRGALTGAALGAVGTPLRQRAARLYGTDRIAAVGGAFAAETGVFTLATQAEKAIEGAIIEPIDVVKDYAKSAATLGIMHASGRLFAGGRRKLDATYGLKPELRFTESEAEELQAQGIDAKALTKGIAQLLGTDSERYLTDEGVMRPLNAQYDRVMSSPQVSAALKAKLMYLVEDKVTVTPPIPVRSGSQQRADGRYDYTTYDSYGNKIETRIVDSAVELNKMERKNRAPLRQNRITELESLACDVLRDHKFFLAVLKTAGEKGFSITQAGRMVFDIAMNADRTEEQRNFFKDIYFKALGSGLGENETERLRNDVEGRLRLPVGTIELIMRKPFEKRSYAEEKTLNAYLKELEKMNRPAEPEPPLPDAGAAVESPDEAAAEPVPEKELTPRERSRLRRQLESEAKRQKSRASRLEIMRARFKPVAEAWERRMNLKINLNYDMEPQGDLNDPEVWKKFKAKGWYDPETDEITINMPNIVDITDFQHVMLHEAAGHRGLHRLLGRNYVPVLEKIYRKIPGNEKYKVWRIMNGRKSSLGDAIAEYVSELAANSSNLTRDERNALEIIGNHIERYITDRGVRVWSTLKKKPLIDMLLDNRPPLSDEGLDEGRFDRLRQKLKEDYERDYEQREEEERKKEAWEKRWFRFLGEKGMGRLANHYDPRSDSKRFRYYADTQLGMEELERAKMFEEEPMRDVSIKGRTGWQRGTDDNWRYEVTDYDFKFYLSPLEKMRDTAPKDYDRYNSFVQMLQKGTKLTPAQLKQMDKIYVKYHLGDDEYPLPLMVKDDMLFKAYPNLKEVRVSFSDDMPSGQECRYYPNSKKLYINKDHFEEYLENYNSPDSEYYPRKMRENDEEDLRLAVLGELQRAIQIEEGFAQTLDLRRMEPELSRRYNNAMQKAQQYVFIDSNYPDFKYPEIGARNQLRRSKFTHEYGMPPEEFLARYANENDYILSQIFEANVTQAADEEIRNVKRRANFTPYDIRNSDMRETEKFPRTRQVVFEGNPFKNVQAPIDIMRDILRRSRRKRYLMGEPENKKKGDFLDDID